MRSLRKTGSDPTPAAVEKSSSEWPEFEGFEESSFAQVNRVQLKEVSRQRVSRLIQRGFPARSKRESARLCAERIGYDPRTVLNWINGSHSAPFDAVFAIGCYVGAWMVLEVMTEGRGRGQVLALITKGARHVLRR